MADGVTPRWSGSDSAMLRRASTRIHLVGEHLSSATDKGCSDGPIPVGIWCRTFSPFVVAVIDVMGSKQTSSKQMLLTFQELREEFGVSDRTLRRLIAERRIAYTRAGTQIRFRRDDVDEYLDRHRVEALDEMQMV
jgi:excisionase family DNA binding protein